MQATITECWQYKRYMKTNLGAISSTLEQPSKIQYFNSNNKQKD